MRWRACVADDCKLRANLLLHLSPAQPVMARKSCVRDGFDLQACAFDGPPQALRVVEVQMPRGIEHLRANVVPHEVLTVRIRNLADEATSRSQDARDILGGEHRIYAVLERVTHDDEVELARANPLWQNLAGTQQHLDADLGRLCNGFRIGVDAHHDVTSALQEDKVFGVPATDLADHAFVGQLQFTQRLVEVDAFVERPGQLGQYLVEDAFAFAWHV